jgi:conjugal transfer pilus assembly protein TraF
VLKGLSEQYNLSLLPVSMDGGPNATFSHYVVNHGQYQRMGLQGGQVPALVLFDTVTKKPIPVGYGVMAADEVMQRIFPHQRQGRERLLMRWSFPENGARWLGRLRFWRRP